MGDERCEVEAGSCDDGQSSEPMTEGSSGPIVGHDSQRDNEDATDDEIGILSHEGAHAAGQPGQGDGVGQCLPDDVTTPQKAPNKANLESKQIMESQELKSETAGAEGRKQSQSSKEETRRKPRSRDGRPARQSGRRPVASEAEGSELLRAAGVPPLRRSDDLDSPGDGQMKSRTYRGVERANHVSRVPETESGWPLPLRPASLAARNIAFRSMLTPCRVGSAVTGSAQHRRRTPTGVGREAWGERIEGNGTPIVVSSQQPLNPEGVAGGE